MKHTLKLLFETRNGTYIQKHTKCALFGRASLSIHIVQKCNNIFSYPLSAPHRTRLDGGEAEWERTHRRDTCPTLLSSYMRDMPSDSRVRWNGARARTTQSEREREVDRGYCVYRMEHDASCYVQLMTHALHWNAHFLFFLVCGLYIAFSAHCHSAVWRVADWCFYCFSQLDSSLSTFVLAELCFKCRASWWHMSKRNIINILKRHI